MQVNLQTDTRVILQGVKEVVLLGQNVNSYRDMSESSEFGGVDVHSLTEMSKGFRTVYKTRSGGRRFSDLLEKVSEVNPEMRIRFTSPHPKDFPDEVRGYEWYLMFGIQEYFSSLLHGHMLHFQLPRCSFLLHCCVLKSSVCTPEP